MAGKKKNGDDFGDAMANFFGDDDLGWLDDEEEEEKEGMSFLNMDGPRPSAVPTLMDPEELRGEIADLLGEPEPEGDAASLAEPVQADADAPTVQDELVPELSQEAPTSVLPQTAPAPPIFEGGAVPDAPDWLEAPSAPVPTEEADPEPVAEEAEPEPEPAALQADEPEAAEPAPEVRVPGDASAETIEAVFATSQPEMPRIEVPAAPPPAAPTLIATEEMYDDLDDDPSEVNQTWTPEDVEEFEDSSPAIIKVDPTLVSGPRSVPDLTRPILVGDLEAWNHAAEFVQASAEAREGVEKGRLLADAAAIYANRLADSAVAEKLLVEAVDLGFAEEPALRLLAEVFGRNGRWEEKAQTLVRIAEATEGRTSAEAFRDAASVVSARSGDHAEAVELLGKALEVESGDVLALSLMRDELAELGLDEERVEILARLADVVDGRLASVLHFERGWTLHKVGRRREAQDAFEAARSADQSAAGPFLALEALFISNDDLVGLGLLYESEASRDHQARGAWWDLKAALTFHRGGQESRAEGALGRAAEGGSRIAASLIQVWNAGTGVDTPGTAKAVAEIEATEEPDAFAYYRLGQLHAAHGELEAALDAFQMAVLSDPKAAPALEQAAWILARRADHAGLAELWSHLEPGDPRLLRLGEIFEQAGQDTQADEMYRRLAQSTPGDPLALDGIRRTNERLGKRAELTSVLDRMAMSAADPQIQAARYHAAGVAGSDVGSDEDLVRFEAALQVAPAQVISLDEACRIWARRGDHREMSDALVRAAEATPVVDDQVAWLYRAGVVLSDFVGDHDGALERFQAVVELKPGHEAAGARIAEISGLADPAGLADMHRAAAQDDTDPDAQVWRLLAAAACDLGSESASTDLSNVLAISPGHPAALGSLERSLLAREDRDELESFYRGHADGLSIRDRAEVLLFIADGLRDSATDAAVHTLTELLDLEADPSVPLPAAARIAQALGAHDIAVSLLESVTDIDARLERADLVAQSLQDPAEALVAFSAVLDDAPDHVGAALTTGRVARRVDDREIMIRAYEVIATHSEHPGLSAAYACWVAGLHEENEDFGAGATAWLKALERLEGSSTAFIGANRCLVRERDVSGIRSLFSVWRPKDTVGFAESVEAASDAASAVELWDMAAESGSLGALFALETALAETEDWQGVFAVLGRRAEWAATEEHRADVDARKRWVLAEKLADTDEAWNLYRQLHEEQPANTEVTEALARIAGARGETELAVTYLQELAGLTSDSAAAARYKRRVGEALETAGDLEGSKQAFLDALAHDSTDRDAMEALKRVGLVSEDWSAVLSVLKLEAGLVEGEERVAVLRQIATITEERGSDSAVSIDAWRAVLDEQEGDVEALTRLFEIAGETTEAGLFVEVGTQLAELDSGMDQAVIYRRMGVACQAIGQDEAAAAHFERAISGDNPDVAAAAALEELYRSHSDWAGIVRVLDVQAHLADDPDGQVAKLEAAARIELEIRHNRLAAGAFFERVLQVKPDHEEALKFQVEHLFEEGDYPAALPRCRALEPLLAELDADDFDVQLELSTFYFRFAEMLRFVGEDAESMNKYEETLKFNPAHLPSLRVVGPLYMANGDWRKAERVYRRLLQLTGGQGSGEEIAFTYTQLGLVERALGHTDKAYKRFNKALELAPNFVPALKGLAFILEDRKDWNTLLNIYNNVIYHATVPQDVVDAYMTKGRILDEELNRADKAMQHFERSLAFNAHQPVALLRLAELCLRQERWSDAVDLVGRGIELAEVGLVVKADLLLLRAIALSHLGETGALREDVLAAVDVNPEVGDADSLIAALDGVGDQIRARLPR